MKDSLADEGMRWIAAQRQRGSNQVMNAPSDTSETLADEGMRWIAAQRQRGSNQVMNAPSDTSETLADEGMRWIAAQKQRAAKTVPTTIGEDVSNLWEGVKKLPQAAVKVGKGVKEHTGQAAAGLLPGLASWADVPAFVNNIPGSTARYLQEKSQNIENPWVQTAAHLALQPFADQYKAPYIFSDTGTKLANEIVGEPKTEEEKAGRVGGELVGAFINPISAAKGVGKGLQFAHKFTSKPVMDVSKYLYKHAPSLPTKSARENLIENIGQDIEEGLKTQKQARQLNLNLTPAEATGNPLLITSQNAAGTSKKGAIKLHEHYKKEKAAQEEVIDDLLNTVHPESKIVNEEIREIAQKVAKEPELIREKAVSPIYEQAYKDTVGEMVPTKAAQSLNKTITDLIREQYPDLPEKTIKQLKEKAFPTLDNMTPENINEIFGEQIYNKLDKEGYFTKSLKSEVRWPEEIRNSKNIMEAIRIAKKDVPYADELINFEPNSVKVLDIAKQVIDAKIEQALKNKDGPLVRAWQMSKKQLLDVIDRNSPNYQKARKTFEDLSPAVEKMRKSKIGKIANMTDEQLKNVSKEIFDRTVTDNKSFAKYRNEISKVSPGAWKALVRQEMERLLQEGDKTGHNFYNSILKDKRMFKKFQSALQGNPEAHKKLNLMNRVFAHIGTAPSAKTSASVMGIPQNVPRSVTDLTLEIGRKLTNGLWDDALVDLIIGNKWDKELRALEKAPKDQQSSKLGKILDAIKDEAGNYSVKNNKKNPISEAISTKTFIPRTAIQNDDEIKSYLKKAPALKPIMKMKFTPEDLERLNINLDEQPSEEERKEHENSKIQTINIRNRGNK